MGDLATTLPFHSARPTITLDGQRNERLAAGLLSLSIHESEHGLYRCELLFGNWGANSEEAGLLFFDRQTLDFGGQIEIELGDHDARAQVFSGRITGIEGQFSQQRPPEIMILAEDRLQDLRMNRRTRSFEDMTVDDVVNQIVNEHSLQSEIDLDSPTYRVLTQTNQSDLAFLRDCARRIDASIWIEGTTLHAQSRSRRQTAELTLTFNQRLHEFSVVADLAHQRTHLAIGGWDIAAKQGYDCEVGQSSIQSELNGDLSGSELLDQKFGRRRDTVVHLTPESDLEVQALAEAYYRKSARRFVTGRGIAEGDGRLRAGAKVTLQQLGEMFNGSYYVTEVNHTYSLTDGYKTFFTVERSGIGQG